jgi:LCP family protein required for cell wall assembly
MASVWNDWRDGMRIIKKILPWVFFSCLAVILVGSLVLRIMNAPLGPKLEVTESAVQPTSTQPETAVDSVSVILPTEVPGVCSGQGSLTLLVLGESFPVNNQFRGADAIRLVQVDLDTAEVIITAFPPDLFVNTSGIPSIKSNASTLTAVYYLAKQSLNDSERNKMAQASNAVAQALTDNFALSPDNYLTMKEVTFQDVINTMGGLPVYFPQTVINPSTGQVFVQAGQQVLTGQQALDYSRFIEGGSPALVSEWNRFDRQNQILVAILQQIFSFKAASSFPGLVNDFYQDVVTDLTPNQLLDLTCVLQNTDASDYKYVEFKKTLISSEQNDILIPNASAVTQYYQTYFTP